MRVFTKYFSFFFNSTEFDTFSKWNREERNRKSVTPQKFFFQGGTYNLGEERGNGEGFQYRKQKVNNKTAGHLTFILYKIQFKHSLKRTRNNLYLYLIIWLGFGDLCTLCLANRKQRNGVVSLKIYFVKSTLSVYFFGTCVEIVISKLINAVWQGGSFVGLRLVAVGSFKSEMFYFFCLFSTA